jgi:hypothetical protein
MRRLQRRLRELVQKKIIAKNQSVEHQQMAGTGCRQFSFG